MSRERITVIRPRLVRWAPRKLPWDLALGAAIPMLVLLPDALRTYAWADDYPLLLEPNEGKNDQTALRHHIADGRVAFGALQHIARYFISQDSDLQAWRLLAAIGVSLAVVLTTLAIRSPAGTTRMWAAIISGIAFTVPTFQLYIQWATAWPFSWSIALSVLALLAVSSKVRFRFGIAMLAIVLALSIYPATAFFLFAVSAIRFTVNRTHLKHASRFLAGLLLLSMMSVISYGLFYLSFLQLSGITLNTKVQPASLNELPNNFAYFLSRHLVVALHPVSVERPTVVSSIVIALPVLLITVTCLWRQAKANLEVPLFRIAVLLTAICVSAFPLLVAGRFVDHRFIPGLAWGFTALALVSAGKLASGVLPPRKIRSVATGGAILLVVLSVYLSHQRFTDLFLSPYIDKMDWLTMELKRCQQPIRAFAIVESDEVWPLRERIGSYSVVSDLSMPWVANLTVDGIIRKTQPHSDWINEREARDDINVCNISLEFFRQGLLR